MLIIITITLLINNKLARIIFYFMEFTSYLTLLYYLFSDGREGLCASCITELTTVLKIEVIRLAVAFKY